MEMEGVAKSFAEMVETCLEDGMQLPFTCAAVGANGSVLAIRYVPNEQGEGLDAVPLCRHFGDKGFAMPINIVVVDSQGEARHFLIEKASVRYLH